MSDDLVPRLLAAIVETEAFAETAGEPDDNWEYRRGASVTPAPKDRSRTVIKFDGGISWHPGTDQVIFAFWEEDLEHIVRHSPSAVLRRCAADRRVVERHTEFHAAVLPAAPGAEPQTERWCTQCRSSRWPCPELVDRAEAYGITAHEGATSG